MIPYSKQDISAADVQAVVQALRSPFITQGPRIAEFERVVARYVGARFAVAFSSGTAALHAAYVAAGVKKGDEVVMSPLTFAATGNAALYLGAKPVFADIESDTGNLDPKEAAKKINRRTKALVAIDYAGLPAKLDELRRLAKKKRIVFIEDAAQALGAVYKGKRVGTQANMTMFSFHPVKSITTGEGGIITTNNKKYYEHMMMFRTHGMTRDPRRLQNKKYGAWHQEMHLLGYNYRITDIQAALGTSQMKRLSRFIAERRAAVRRYAALFKNTEGIALPQEPKGIQSAWHLYPIRLTGRYAAERDKVFAALRAKGIGVQVHYLPVYLHPFYQRLGYKKGLCPKAEQFSFSELSIPLYPKLSQREQEKIVRLIHGALK